MQRECGDCTICCKLLPVQRRPEQRQGRARVIEELVARKLAAPDEFNGMIDDFDKPAGVRCEHQRSGKGCAIYPRRPFSCRMWNCRWLVKDDTGSMSRPDRAHYVIDIMPDYVTLTDNETGESRNVEVVQVWVDPHYPDAHKDKHLRAYLERRGAEGKAAIIRFNAHDAFTLFPPQMAGDGEWHIVHGTPVAEHTPAELFKMIEERSA